MTIDRITLYMFIAFGRLTLKKERIQSSNKFSFGGSNCGSFKERETFLQLFQLLHMTKFHILHQIQNLYARSCHIMLHSKQWQRCTQDYTKFNNIYIPLRVYSFAPSIRGEPLWACALSQKAMPCSPSEKEGNHDWLVAAHIDTVIKHSFAWRTIGTRTSLYLPQVLENLLPLGFLVGCSISKQEKAQRAYCLWFHNYWIWFS